MGARRVLSWAVYGLPWLALQTFYRSFYRLVRRRRHRHFVFRGQELEYFYHRYNFTWRNERIVEVPIAWSFVEAAGDRRVLEVGNVLSHYFPHRHTVLDKYDRAPGVINEDALTFAPGERYDVIVSISTLEHVGWDEDPRDPDKPVQVATNLARLLRPGGLLVASLPIGYNPHVDRSLGSRRFPFTETYCLKRVSRDNRWQEVDWADIRDARYGVPFPSANGIVVGIVRCPPAVSGRA